MRNDIVRDRYEKDGSLFDGLVEELRQAVPSAGYEYAIWILRGGLDPRSKTEFRTYPERIEAAGRSGVPEYGVARVNTFPFGMPTKEVYPEFVGICAGSERINRVFDQAVRQCRQTRKKYSPDIPKSVIILTDKWNDPLFQDQYERTFIRFALENRVMFVFLLVTAYGITRIPFLAKDRGELDRLREARPWVENDPAADVRELLSRYPFARYSCDGGTWGRLLENAAGDYRFDFEHGICYISGNGYEEDKKTVIPAPVRYRFTRRVLPLYYEWERDPVPEPDPVLDGPNHTVCLFGREFCWRGPAAAQPAFYQRLKEAFEELIGEWGKSGSEKK